jgi:hypothetical protein
MAQAPRKLSDSQVEAFDIEFVRGERLGIVQERISRDFPDGRFAFLDVGGGNGAFADRLLDAYPLSRGTVLDNSQVLLSRNKPRSQKDLVCGSATDLQVLSGPYDLICMNFLLHHLVGNSYEASGRHVAAALTATRPLLSARGRVSIRHSRPSGPSRGGSGPIPAGWGSVFALASSGRGSSQEAASTSSTRRSRDPTSPWPVSSAPPS